MFVSERNSEMTFDDSSKMSLQDAFKKFREKRMEQIQTTKKMMQKPLEEDASSKRVEWLRAKFVNQALKYLGVPYAKKYHEKGSPDYDAPMYLDCCALVRRVLLDMKTELGFRIGRWNQAYQFDTLPITIEKEEDMKPGDLVFISGTYFNNSRKAQKHNMVHVEIWLGDGEKTVGARYHKGRVQIHNSYKFVSKSYHSMKYHFKSIDTWLNGICQSFCSTHAWRSTKYLNHGKKSIFTEQSNEDANGESAGDSDNDDEEKENIDMSQLQNHIAIEDDINRRSEKGGNPTQYLVDFHSTLASEKNPLSPGPEEMIETNPECLVHSGSDSMINRKNSLPNANLDEKFSTAGIDLSELLPDSSDDPSCGCMGMCGCDCSECILYNSIFAEAENLEIEEDPSPKSCPSAVDAKKQKPSEQLGSRASNGNMVRKENWQKKSSNNSPSKTPAKQLSVAVSSLTRSKHRTAPKFYIGGKNGVALVEKPLLEKGWQRIDDSNDLSYYLKWVECKSKIDYKSFRAGEQLVNHIPNGGCLTTKTGLLKSLQDYARVYNRTLKGSSSKLDLHEFYPETYKVENRIDLEMFTRIFADGETWICKPSGLNQGKGIFLLRDPKQLREAMYEKSKKRIGHSSTARIVSRYIESPLLLNGCKFDIRAYMLVASTTPYLVLYHNGYVRLACSPYSKDSTDLTIHLTNQFVQKKHPDYCEKKDDSVWTFENLNNYINVNYKDTNGLVDDWALTDMTDRIKEIMLICFRSVEHKLERKSGYFDLLGFDFMIDDNMKVWLLEINVNPALFTNCESLRKVIPGIVEETVQISVEAFENKCSRKRIFPIESLKTFEVLYDEERKISFERVK